MTSRQRRSALRWAIVIAVITATVIALLQPPTIEVETAVVDVGVIEQVLENEGKVRLANKHLIAMPVTGELVVLDIKPGDTISKGQVIAYYRVVLLDERTHKELTERLRGTDQAVVAARAQMQAVEPGMQHLEKQIGRLQRLVRLGASSLVELEQLQLRYDELQKQYIAAEARMVQTQHEALAMQRGALMSTGTGLPIRSPISGVVLRRIEDQSRVLTAGMPIYEIGSMDSVEIVVDVLSRDAAQLTSGMVAQIAAGNGDTIAGIVQRIEPAAHTKISALGIEEQRVDVIVKPRAPFLRVGDAYRVDVTISLWKIGPVTRMPRNAVLIDGQDTSCFVVVDGRATNQRIGVGRLSSSLAEIRSGCPKGATVVVNPARALTSGARVRELH